MQKCTKLKGSVVAASGLGSFWRCRCLCPPLPSSYSIFTDSPHLLLLSLSSIFLSAFKCTHVFLIFKQTKRRSHTSLLSYSSLPTDSPRVETASHTCWCAASPHLPLTPQCTAIQLPRPHCEDTTHLMVNPWLLHSSVTLSFRSTQLGWLTFHQIICRLPGHYGFPPSFICFVFFLKSLLYGYLFPKQDQR